MRADFPHTALLLALCQGLWDLSVWERFRQRIPVADAVVAKQPQLRVNPLTTPPLPTETPAFPCTHQMTTHLLLDPVANVFEAATRVTDTKVVSPAPQDRVDSVNQLAR